MNHDSSIGAMDFAKRVSENRSIDQLISLFEDISIERKTNGDHKKWLQPEFIPQPASRTLQPYASYSSSLTSSNGSDFGLAGSGISQTGTRRFYHPLAGKERKPTNRWAKKRAIAIPQLVCTFCKKNGETKALYTTHILKDGNGIIVCPVLRSYPCPICGNQGGDFAHTKRFCPKNPDRYARCGMPMPELLKSRPNSTGKRSR